MSSENNRSFFRINTMIPCGYRILSKDEYLNKEKRTVIDVNYIEEYFLEGFHELDSQIKNIVVKIGQKSDLLAQALTALNSKMNFILQTVDVKQLSRTIPLRMVNLSAGGIQFKIDEKINSNHKIEILLQLSSEEDPILAICDIVSSTIEKDGSTLASLKYNFLTEEDRRKLIYFIQEKEIEHASKKDA